VSTCGLTQVVGRAVFLLYAAIEHVLQYPQVPGIMLARSTAELIGVWFRYGSAATDRCWVDISSHYRSGLPLHNPTQEAMNLIEVANKLATEERRLEFLSKWLLLENSKQPLPKNARA
jgi:hypothetical protein